MKREEERSARQEGTQKYKNSLKVKKNFSMTRKVFTILQKNRIVVEALF